LKYENQALDSADGEYDAIIANTFPQSEVISLTVFRQYPTIARFPRRHDAKAWDYSRFLKNSRLNITINSLQD